jgi:hypothetical protein
MPAASAAAASAASCSRPSGLREAGGDRHGRGDSSAAALLYDGSGLLGAYSEQRQVGRLGKRLNVGKAGEAEVLAAARIHRVDTPLVPSVEDVLERRAAPARDIARRADDSHRLRSAHRSQIGHDAAFDRRLAPRVKVEHHEGVDRDRTAVDDEQRVDVDLYDLGKGDGQMPDRHEDIRQRLPVHLGQTAEAAQKPLRADLPQELPRLGMVQRRDTQGDVLKRLRIHAAQAKGHDRPEGGVALHAHEELAVAGEHLLHQHAVEVVAGPHGDVAVGSAHCLGVANVQRDEPSLGLVPDVGADSLDHDRTVDGRGGRGGGVLVMHHGARRHGDVAGGEQCLGLGLVEGLSPGTDGMAHRIGGGLREAQLLHSGHRHSSLVDLRGVAQRRACTNGL